MASALTASGAARGELENEVWSNAERALRAASSSRRTVSATLYGRAATAARELHGAASLIYADLLLDQAASLLSQGNFCSPGERTALLDASWELQKLAIGVVFERDAAGTLVLLESRGAGF